MPSAKQRQAARFGDLLLEQAAGPLSLQEEAAAAEASLLRLPGAVLVPIERLAPNPDNPRQQLQHIHELAISLADRGALQPLVVRRDPDHPGYYLVVAGTRRLAAAQLARTGGVGEVRVPLDALPCVIADEAGPDAFADALAENVARDDLTRAELMEGVLRLHNAHGWSARAIARRLGRHFTDIAELLRLAQDPEVAQLVRDETIAPTVGAQISALDLAEREAALEAVREGTLRTGSDLARLRARPAPRADTMPGPGVPPPPEAAPALTVPLALAVLPAPGVPPAPLSTAPTADSPAVAAQTHQAAVAPTPASGAKDGAPILPADRPGMGHEAAAARHAAQEGLRRVAAFDDESFAAVLELLAYGKSYRKQWQNVIDDLLRERARRAAANATPTARRHTHRQPKDRAGGN